jgi:hypothetical protein
MHRRSWHGITPPFFSNFLFTNLFSIKFLYFFIISSLFPYFNLFVSIFIQSYVNIKLNVSTRNKNLFFIPPLPEGGGGYTVLPLSVLPSVQDIFRRIFLSNCWWQKSNIWSQASYRYTILWVAFLDPSDSYFLKMRRKISWTDGRTEVKQYTPLPLRGAGV